MSTEIVDNADIGFCARKARIALNKSMKDPGKCCSLSGSYQRLVVAGRGPSQRG
jgi:hypothetical protein